MADETIWRIQRLLVPSQDHFGWADVWFVAQRGRHTKLQFMGLEKVLPEGQGFERKFEGGQFLPLTDFAGCQEVICQ